MDCLTVPRHLVVSSGKVSPKTDSAIKDHTPKQIQYKHTIRVITPFSCSHEEDIKQVKAEYEEKMQAKQKEIDMIRKELKEKMVQIERKDEEIERLKQSISSQQCSKSFMKASIMDNKLERSQITDIFKSRIDHPCFSNIKTSFIFNLNSNEQPEDKQAHRLEEEFQNMQNSLKDLSTALNKPKKRYQFFTRAKQQHNVDLPTKIQKVSQIKNGIVCSDFLEQEDNFDNDESMDHTSTNQSFDATDFLEQAIQEHKILRDTLLELQKSTKLEMQQMKKYYQGQIEGYKRIIEQQRQKSRITKIEPEKIVRNHEYHLREQQFGSILRGMENNCENAGHVLDND